MAEEYVISVVLEGNASSLTSAQSKATQGNKSMEKSATDANVAFLANIAVFQATVAALNQVSGGLNKTAGALDKLGAKDTAKVVRGIATAFEIVAGPLEVILAGFTFYIVLTSAAAKSALGFSVANFALGSSLAYVAFNLAALLLAAAPFVALIGILYMVNKHFDILGKTINVILNPIEALNNALEKTQDILTFIVDPLVTVYELGSGAFSESFTTLARVKGGA